jgi:hypothetical protein
MGYIGGRLPVLVSAPHAAAHFRKGEIKEEDEYTGALAQLVGELSGAHVLYVRRKLAGDPNYDTHAPYKEALRQEVERHRLRFVLDLHGARQDRDFGLALGTLNGRSCPGQMALILEVLKAHGFQRDILPSTGPKRLSRLDVDNQYSGARIKGQETVTRFAWERLGIPAAQVEINAWLRVVNRKADATHPEEFQGDPAGIERTIASLTALVKVLEKDVLGQ